MTIFFSPFVLISSTMACSIKFDGVILLSILSPNCINMIFYSTIHAKCKLIEKHFYFKQHFDLIIFWLCGCKP